MPHSYLALPLFAITLAMTACSGEVAQDIKNKDQSVAATQQASAAPLDKSPGARLYLQCRACHTLDASGANGVGPNLHAVVGAKAGTKAGYQYSRALAQSGIIWTPDKLDAFLTKPNTVVPGTKMAFAGIASEQARRDLIAYLQKAGSK